MSAFTGLRPCLGLATRRYRWQVLAWMVPLWLFLLGHPIALQRMYPSFEERTALLSQMRGVPGVRLLFGPLPAAGSVGEFASWEDGGYLLWFVAGATSRTTTSRSSSGRARAAGRPLHRRPRGRWVPWRSRVRAWRPR